MSNNAMTLLDHLSNKRTIDEILELSRLSRTQIRELKMNIKRTLQVDNLSIAVQAYTEWVHEAEQQEDN